MAKILAVMDATPVKKSKKKLIVNFKIKKAAYKKSNLWLLIN